MLPEGKSIVTTQKKSEVFGLQAHLVDFAHHKSHKFGDL